MSEIHNEKAFYRAIQLVKIAEIECEGKITSESALVIGDNASAKAVAEIIGCKAVETTEDIEKMAAENRFNAVFLFADIGETLLCEITRTNAAVIDMTEYKSGKTVNYSCQAPYRRIRVVSLFEHEKN